MNISEYALKLCDRLIPKCFPPSLLTFCFVFFETRLQLALLIRLICRTRGAELSCGQLVISPAEKLYEEAAARLRRLAEEVPLISFGNAKRQRASMRSFFRCREEFDSGAKEAVDESGRVRMDSGAINEMTSWCSVGMGEA